MKLQLVILLIAAIAVCALIGSSYAQDDASKHQPTEVVRTETEKPSLFSFDFYVKRFNKHYRSTVEMLVRQKIFLGRAFRAFISAIKYRHYQLSHYLSVNPYSDETPEERAKRYINPENFKHSTSRLNSHIEHKPEIREVPVAEMEDIERELKEIEERKDEPGYQELAEEVKKMQSHQNERRRKRDTSGSNKRDIKLEDLIEPSEDSVINQDKTGEKFRLRVPSNNPSYEQPELSSSAAGDAEDKLSKPISESVMSFLSSIPGADYVKSVVKNAIGGDTEVEQLSADGKLPDKVFVDLRDTDCFFQPRRQGDCGSCWAFTAIALYEYLFCHYTGTLIAFSEQFLVDCGGVFSLNGCEGGSTRNVALFVDAYGLELRSDYPYRYKNDTCPYEESLDPSKTGYIKIHKPQSALLEPRDFDWYLREKQKPIMFSMNLPKDFSDYGGGVADGIECGAEGGHGMLLIGHGREDGKEYYLFRNSHSVSWGESGYYKFNKADIERCSITQGVISNGRFKRSDAESKNPNHHDHFVKGRYVEYVKKGAKGQVKEIY